MGDGAVRSTRPPRSLRSKLWTTLAVIAFTALAGAVLFGGGRESRDAAALLSAPANATPFLRARCCLSAIGAWAKPRGR